MTKKRNKTKTIYNNKLFNKLINNIINLKNFYYYEEVIYCCYGTCNYRKL